LGCVSCLPAWVTSVNSIQYYGKFIFNLINLAGAVISGRLADIAVIRGRNRRQGKWNPEDRLLAAIPGALLIVPFSLIAFALSIVFIPGKVGLTISLVCLFFNGMGVRNSQY
jgi:hypothetical protein